MPERIDFALDPAVIVFAILAFVLLTGLLVAVVYPYLRSDPSDNAVAPKPESDTHPDMVPEKKRQPLEKRVQEFYNEMHKGRRQ